MMTTRPALRPSVPRRVRRCRRWRWSRRLTWLLAAAAIGAALFSAL